MNHTPMRSVALLLSLAWFSAIGDLLASGKAEGEATPITAVLRYPADSGFIDARQFGAIPDDDVDDTAAIQAALDAYPDQNRVIYLPGGTYQIRDTLHWPEQAGTTGSGGGTILEGAGSSQTILRLADAAPGFTDSAKPKAVIWTGNSTLRGARNAIHGLSVIIGEGNPGAIALQFHTIAQGSIRDLTLSDPSRTARIGLDLSRGDEIGPLLVRDLTVEGFEYGIVTKWPESSTILERIHLSGQRRLGWWNYHQAVVARSLVSENRVPAFYNEKDSWGAAVLLESRLSGMEVEKGAPGIHNQRQLYLHDVEISGYARAVDNDDQGRDKGDIDGDQLIVEDTSHREVYSLFREIPDGTFASAGEVPHLPIQEAPEIPWGDLGKDWVNILNHGADPSGATDSSFALQQAIDSGAKTVYLPGGAIFRFDSPVEIRGPVSRIIGLEGRLLADGGPIWRLVDGKHPDLLDAPAVVIERLDVHTNSGRGTLQIRHESKRTLIVSSSSGVSVEGVGSGDLFLEDIAGSLTALAPGQSAWCRQLNIPRGAKRCRNAGGKLWCLGLKSRGISTVVETSGGGTTEIFGVILRPDGEWKTGDAAFVSTDAELRLFGVSERDFNLQPVTLWVRESHGADVRELSSRPWVYLGK